MTEDELALMRGLTAGIAGHAEQWRKLGVSLGVVTGNWLKLAAMMAEQDRKRISRRRLT